MNAKIIDALKGVRDNLDVIIEEVQKTPPVTTGVEKVEKSEEKTNVIPIDRKAKKELEVIPDVDSELTEEMLGELSYNNLKKLAKEMGITASGSRDELTRKILAGAPDAEEEEVEEEKPKAKSKPAKPEPEEEEEEDPIVEQVNEAVADMSDEDILDILAEVGVKARGKRQALISAVIKAVNDGKISLGDDDDDEEVMESDEVEADDDSSEEEYDVNDPENPEMTEERREALEAFDEEVRNDFEEGTIVRKDMVEWLNAYHQTKDAMRKKSDEDILDEYIYYASLSINDEGEMPEEDGAYSVNGVPYCCGHELQYDEESEVFTCGLCETSYSAE